MFLPPDFFARADSEQRRHAPNKPPAVAVIMCILVAVIMMLAPLFYGKGVLGRCFTTRASHPPRERIVFLTPEALELVPITKYRAWREGKHDRSFQKGTNSSITSFESSQECSICTEEFLEDVRLRSLPCGHSFHPDCIDPWLLERSVTCPMCRFNVTTGLSTASKMPARPRRVLFITELRAQRRSIPRVKLTPVFTSKYSLTQLIGYQGSPCLHYCLNYSVRRAGNSNPSTTFSPRSNSDADSCGSPGADGPYVEVICGVVGVEKWQGEDSMTELGWSSGIRPWKSREQICLSIKFAYLFHDCRVNELSEEDTVEFEGSEVGAKSEYAEATSEGEGEL